MLAKLLQLEEIDEAYIGMHMLPLQRLGAAILRVLSVIKLGALYFSIFNNRFRSIIE